MKSAYLMAAMPAGTLLPLLFRNGVSPAPRYLLRMAFLLQSGMWSSFLAARERAAHGASLASARAPTDPAIIIGHWRTGSTFLHQLLACDDQFAAPSLYQVSYPTSFMTSRRYVEPIMKRMLPPTRPMDNMSLGMDEPMEEESALFRICGLSPLERLIFARSPEYFLLRDETFLPSANQVSAWESALQGFLTRLCLHTGKRPLLKNPFHSMRIPMLRRLFPEAKFIHIYRDPHVVVPSTVRMWSIVGAENTMRNRWRTPRFEDVTDVLGRVLDRIRRDLVDMPAGAWCDVRFEDLEREPLGCVRNIYARLELELSPGFEQAAKRFVDAAAGYEKNRYELSDRKKNVLQSVLRHHLLRDGYPAY